MEKIATRVAYGEALAELGAKYENIVVLDADLSKSTRTDLFKKKFPDRFINAGIAEGNMMSVAAGIATTGKIPFASTFAMFAAGRAFEPIRNSIGYPHLNVKIGATHAGITVGEDGATHQCNEDMALMRMIPGMTVICPADAVETRAAVEAAVQHYGPVYLRLGRLNVPVLYDPASYRFELGKGVVVADGADAAIVATGVMVAEAVEARRLLADAGIDAAVLDIHTIKPLDEQLILHYAAKTGALVTAEEHSVLGGLGGAVTECVCNGCPVPVKRVGIRDKFGKSGKPELLMAEYGITAKEIVAAVKEAVAAKK